MIGVGFSEALVSAVDRRVYFLFDGKKKVAKEKATPGSAPGCARSPALLAVGGGCGTRPYGPQTVLALFPPTPALLGASQGARHTDRNFAANSRSTADGEIATLLGAPMWSAEQRRRAGGSRRGLSEGRSPEFRSRPRSLGSPFLWLLSFGETKESTPARQARKTSAK